MAVRKPVVRHFIACEKVEALADRRITLHRLIHTIRPLPGIQYPRIHPELYLYVQVTEGSGRQSFRIEVVTWDDEGNEVTVRITPAVTVEFGSDPLAMQCWPIRMKNLLFAHAGIYEFRLVCGSDVIARESILLKENR